MIPQDCICRLCIRFWEVNILDMAKTVFSLLHLVVSLGRNLQRFCQSSGKASLDWWRCGSQCRWWNLVPDGGCARILPLCCPSSSRWKVSRLSSIYLVLSSDKYWLDNCIGAHIPRSTAAWLAGGLFIHRSIYWRLLMPRSKWSFAIWDAVRPKQVLDEEYCHSFILQNREKKKLFDFCYFHHPLEMHTGLKLNAVSLSNPSFDNELHMI